ncbi:MAG: DUF424 family protein [Promethearchaeota archaeon]|nr:MAG: DUF424 family protein [Candidatus Lokiarchaeota archaeon]
MKVYCKNHKQPDYLVIAVCDEDILGKHFGTQKISEHFYKGELLDIPEAIDILREAPNFNIAGKFIVKACIETKIINEEGVIIIDDIPFAMKVLL